MNSFDTSRFQILPNGTLLINKVIKEDEDVYGCTAGNSAGLNRKDVKLIVYCKYLPTNKTMLKL